MACHLHPIDEDECVCLAYTCKLTGSESESALHSMNALLRTTQWNRVLVDLSKLDSDPTTLELFEFAENLCLEISRNVWIAVWVRLEHERRARLVARVAGNRGVILGCFTDARHAAVWMKSGAASGGA